MSLEDDYTRLLYHLLPPGPAWEGDNPLLNGLAPSLAAVHQRGDDLMREIDPAQTVELIGRYETLCGLPDSCAPPACKHYVNASSDLTQKLIYRAGLTNGFTANSWMRWVITRRPLNNFRIWMRPRIRSGAISGAITGA